MNFKECGEFAELTGNQRTKIPQMRINMNIIKREKVETSTKTLKKYLVKKVQGHDWRFQHEGLKKTDLELRQLVLASESSKRLQRFEIDCLRCEGFRTGLNRISGGLKTFRSLQHLHLNFGHSRVMRDSEAFEISQGLKKLGSLNCVFLDFKWCHDLSDKGFSHLVKALKKSSSLSQIRLDFEQCWKITDQGLRDVGKTLKRFASLQEFYLNLQEYAIF